MLNLAKDLARKNTFDPENLREYGLENKSYDELDEMYQNGEIEMVLGENGRVYITKVY